MPLNRTPPSTQVEGLSTGEQPVSNSPTTEPSTATSAGQTEDNQGESIMLRSFNQATENLHQRALSSESGELELRDGLRDLITHKAALDAANMSGAISKTDFLAAEKRFTQARTTVLHRVKALNSQVKNLTDLVRHDVPLAAERHFRPRRRSRSRSQSPRNPGLSTRMDPASALSQAALLNTSRGLIGDQHLASSLASEQIRFAPTTSGLYVASANSSVANSQFLPIPTSVDHLPRPGPITDVVDLANIGVRTLPPSRPSHTQSAFVNVTSGNQAETRSVNSMNSVMRVIAERENLQHTQRAVRDEQDAYFAREYGMESADMSSIIFPEGWRYPDDRNFERYFEKMDYLKAKKAGTLRAFDGTIASYPDFRLAFYRQVHVQRGAILEKITTLDSLMPAKFYKEHFKGLDLTIHDYKVRIERLEKHFGGNKRQLEHLLSRLGEFLKNPSAHSPKDLQSFVYAIENHFKKPSTPAAQKEVLSTFLQVVLPDSTRVEYHQFLLKDKKEDNSEHFLEFLQMQLEAEIRNKQQKAVFMGSSAPARKGGALVTLGERDSSDEPSETEGHCFAGERSKNMICEFCNHKPHPLFRCYKFASASHEEKMRHVKEKSLCFKCLKTGHMLKECTILISCEFCDSPYNTKHNRLLHKDEQPLAMNTYGTVLKAGRQRLGSRPFSSACVVLHLKCPKTGTIHAINALADTGASDFLVDTSVMDRLKLTGKGCQFTVLGHGGHESTHDCIAGDIAALNPETGEEYNLGYYAYEGPCEGMFPEDWSQLKANWPHLRHLDIPPPVKGKHIEAIVGCKYLSLFEASAGEDIHRGKHVGDPVAKRTPLGWVVAGKTSTAIQGQAMNISGCFNGFAIVAGTFGDGRAPDYKQLYFQLKRDLSKVWNLETEEEMKRLANCYSPAPKTVLEARAEATFCDTLVFTELNKYRVGLLWKSDLRPCSNYGQARAMFLKLEQELEGNPERLAAFHQAHKDWLEAGYLEPRPDEPEQMDQFFLPGFIIGRETSHGKSFRYVMDGARVFQGKSLNDHLLPGQNAMNNLAEVLLRFRRHPYVLTCDIKGMFLGIEVLETDREYLKVFYRERPDQTLLVYRCTRHVFGLCCSPYVAMSTVMHHALKSAHKWPLALKLLRENTIVDDILASFPKRGDLAEARKQLEEFFDSMSLKPHKWASNDAEVLRTIPPEDRAKVVRVDSEDPTTDQIRTLGILWLSETDEFQYIYEPEPPPRWTLRGVASLMGKLFDPMCVLGPCSVTGKLLLQLAWAENRGWDEPLPEILCKKFTTYLTHHLHTKNLRIPRQAIAQGELLVIFTDASTQALAAAAYVINDHISGLGPRLLWAKNKLASLKGNETVPRLELGAAVMGTELAFFICKTFGWDLNRVLYFSDSMTVLWWMQSTQMPNPYVANRLQKISERSSYQQWLHVKTEENPADLPTRGVRPEKLRGRALWWEGPEFLKLQPEEWEPQPQLYETEEAAAERRTLESICRNVVLAVRLAAVEVGPMGKFLEDLIQDVHGLEKGCRVAQLVNEAVAKFQKKYYNPVNLVTIVLQYAQASQFTALKGALQRGTIPDAQYWPLRPFIDEEGLIRINSRLTPHLECDRNQAQPILLHKDMKILQPLLWEIHAQILKHCGGINTLLARVREKYWVIQGKSCAKDVVNNCLFCARMIARPYKLPLPPLHPSRSSQHQRPLRAFQEIGIDFCGPFKVAVGRSLQNRYALVLACCATRAVNVEVCHSLSGQSCLAALERHCARYSQPSYINSDNGSNFLASARHLEERIEVLRQHHLPEHRRWHPNIQWYFNPPSSPTWTGHVECFVKLVKSALKRLEPRYRQTFTEESLSTALTMTIGYINSRPLLSVEPEKPPLTPASFLLTGAPELFGVPVGCEEHLTLKSRKELLDVRLDKAWNSFQRDYLLSLRQRDKAWPSSRVLEIGDAVLLQDEDYSNDPRRWRAGKVMNIHEPKDDLRRSYDILVDGEITYKRNYRTLAKLPSPSFILPSHLQESTSLGNEHGSENTGQ